MNMEINKSLIEDYEAPFAEIVEVDLVAVMTWSGIHRTFDPEETEPYSYPEEDDDDDI